MEQETTQMSIKDLITLYSKKTTQLDELKQIIKKEIYNLLPGVLEVQLKDYKQYPPVDNQTPSITISLKLREITQTEIQTFKTITNDYTIQKSSDSDYLDVELFI